MHRNRTRLSYLSFEERVVPAIDIQIDYRFDTLGFFNDSTRRAAVERAATELEARLDNNFQAITPSGNNSWNAIFYNPATGSQTEVANLSVPAKTIVVFAGARDLPGTQAGVGGTGGYRANGNASWFGTLANRGQSGISMWGGSLAFDTNTNWYYPESTAGLSGSLVDLQTVAVHELGHLLGFGTVPKFDTFVSGREFTGPNTVAANGGVAPFLSSDLSHWNQGTTSNGNPASMQPYVAVGKRYGFSTLDFAALSDIGWTVTGAPTVPVVTPPNGGNPTVPPVNTQYEPIVLSGTGDGLAYTVRYINGEIVSDGFAVKPFADFSGVLRSETGDVNGDGVTDVIYATGPGGPSRFTVINGSTGAVLLAAQTPFGSEFTGGLFLSSADIDRDGKSEIIVSPDQGGGGRVTVFKYNSGAVTRMADFFGIEDVNFRGGARVAAGDMNGDGTPDVIVGAGFGGGPRVALFDGRTISQAKPPKFVGDFFAFPGDAATKLRNGVYLTVGDVNRDGKSDLIFGAGPGGGPQVYVLDGAKILANNVAGAQASPLTSFFAFDINDRGGVRVTAEDVDNDGQIDLIAGSGSENSVAWYRSFNPTQPVMIDAANLTFTSDGVYVGACQCDCGQCGSIIDDDFHDAMLIPLD